MGRPRQTKIGSIFQTLNRQHGLALCAVVGSLAATGCVCPPCPGAGAASPSAASGSSGTSAAAATPVASGSRLVIWNGDGESAGANPQSWADCDKKPTCKAALKPESGVGQNGSTALKFHGEGSGWLGGGWNWFGWWPEDSGTDISPYGNLTFSIRLDAKSAQDAPEPGAITVSMGCSKGKKNSASPSLEKYARGLGDGKWHKVVIPLAELYKKEGAQFDPHTAWEFRIGAWSGSPKNFDLYIDDIAVEKP